mmetsp:Transcript_63889/g.151119  ORF Transcript_63889/g.151119 Transcript_63889/m.151119 type:complete len:297 (+) Transcript_63889:64-954(+)|eukprot:CAMPEP_0175841562 /NCGR_PEP_ID=MMETSP0107_2-20121207/20002_1 /TAXON_ID=195067 ORGANISM="Goniomonas pacifica, Strain CCMP1869" /NCGR_SAMPLE_ID=MMETSP0107_2 /ASSEMBLY_ACC=CAM_ASM_000203 /LENGTH=296 /DNA_ID=CAMNT_0017155551 /DNA_START=59 /DNA_END=949 /DNA_ORIENTATION=+
MADQDWYEILGCAVTATPEELSKAYRQMARKYHPDKNKDNPKAVEFFLQVTKAFDTLSDPKERAVYDEKVKAKLAARKRTEQMDSKRREMKQSLEAREKEVESTRLSAAQSKARQAAELARLREENKAMLQQMQERVEQEQQQQERRRQELRATSRTYNTVRLRWKKGDHTEASIRDTLGRFGAIDTVLIAPKGRRAVVVFASEHVAAAAVASADSPFKISWPKDGAPPTHLAADGAEERQEAAGGVGKRKVEESAAAPPPPPRVEREDMEDYEAETMRRMMQAAAEAKRSKVDAQ